MKKIKLYFLILLALVGHKSFSMDMGEGVRMPSGTSANIPTDFWQFLFKLKRLWNDDKKSFSARLSDSIQDGLIQGVSAAVAGAIVSASSEYIKGIPSSARNTSNSVSSFLYRTLAGQKPVDWNSLALINNRLYTLLTPFTQVTIGNFAKELRKTNLTSEGADENWEILRSKVISEIDHYITQIQATQIWYCPTARRKYANFINKLTIRFKNCFSSMDCPQMKFRLEQILIDLSNVKRIFFNAKSFAEIQQNHETVKTWVNVLCNDLEHLANILEQDSLSTKNPSRVQFLKPAGSSSQKQQMLDELLSAANGIQGLGSGN